MLINLWSFKLLLPAFWHLKKKSTVVSFNSIVIFEFWITNNVWFGVLDQIIESLYHMLHINQTLYSVDRWRICRCNDFFAPNAHQIWPICGFFFDSFCFIGQFNNFPFHKSVKCAPDTSWYFDYFIICIIQTVVSDGMGARIDSSKFMTHSHHCASIKKLRSKLLMCFVCSCCCFLLFY